MSSDIIDVTGDNVNRLLASNETNKTARISYTELRNTASELCRLVSNDQRSTRTTYVKIKEWINRLRRNEKFDIVFHSFNLLAWEFHLFNFISSNGEGCNLTARRWGSITEISYKFCQNTLFNNVNICFSSFIANHFHLIK